MRVCLVCGGKATPAQGVYLALLYPGTTFCRGCGRRQLYCTCRRAGWSR